ncbi:hypothetical protein BHE74_00049938, partial [Ensete ventricosum]
FSWSKTLVRKWFNIKNKSQDFHADDDVFVGRGDDREWRMRSAGSEACMVKKSRTGKTLVDLILSWTTTK